MYKGRLKRVITPEEILRRIIFRNCFPLKPIIVSVLIDGGNEIEIKMTKPDVLSSPLQAKPDVLYPPLQNKPLSFSLPAVYKHLFGECGVWSVQCRV